MMFFFGIFMITRTEPCSHLQFYVNNISEYHCLGLSITPYIPWYTLLILLIFTPVSEALLYQNPEAIKVFTAPQYHIPPTPCSVGTQEHNSSFLFVPLGCLIIPLKFYMTEATGSFPLSFKVSHDILMMYFPYTVSTSTWALIIHMILFNHHF